MTLIQILERIDKRLERLEESTEELKRAVGVVQPTSMPTTVTSIEERRAAVERPRDRRTRGSITAPAAIERVFNTDERPILDQKEAYERALALGFVSGSANPSEAFGIAIQKAVSKGLPLKRVGMRGRRVLWQWMGEPDQENQV
jgi:hypothetical protein